MRVGAAPVLPTGHSEQRAAMCDVTECPSEVGSCSVGGDEPDAMLDILDEFQRLYQERMARLDRDPTSPTYSKVTAPPRHPIPIPSIKVTATPRNDTPTAR